MVEVITPVKKFEVRHVTPAEVPAEREIKRSGTNKYTIDGHMIDTHWRILPPKRKEHEPSPKKTVIFLPGWSMAGDTKTAQTIAQAYADKEGAQAILMTTRNETIMRGSLQLEAQAIVQEILAQGLEHVTFVGHSEGSIKAMLAAAHLQKASQEAQVQQVDSTQVTIPTVDSLILLDSVGLYKHRPFVDLGWNFVKDMLTELPAAKKVKSKYKRNDNDIAVQKERIRAKLREERSGQLRKELGREPTEDEIATEEEIEEARLSSFLGAAELAPDRTWQAGLDIGVHGIWEEFKRSPRTYLKRLTNQVKDMAEFDPSTEENQRFFDYITAPVIVVTGEHDRVSDPEKIFPEYKHYTWENGMVRHPDTGELFDPRQRYLQARIFKQSPYIRMVTADDLGYHGLPQSRPENIAGASGALVRRSRDARDVIPFSQVSEHIDGGAWAPFDRDLLQRAPEKGSLIDFISQEYRKAGILGPSKSLIAAAAVLGGIQTQDRLPAGKVAVGGERLVLTRKALALLNDLWEHWDSVKGEMPIKENIRELIDVKPSIDDPHGVKGLDGLIAATVAGDISPERAMLGRELLAKMREMLPTES